MKKTRVATSESELIEILSKLLKEPTVFRASEIKTLLGGYGAYFNDHKLADFLKSNAIPWLTPRTAGVAIGSMDGGIINARYYSGSKVYDAIKENLRLRGIDIVEENPLELRKRLSDYVV